MDAETGEDMLSGLAECFNLDVHAYQNSTGSGRRHAGRRVPRTRKPSTTSWPHPAPGSRLADQLVAIGHRIVHGGEQFSLPVRIDEGVIAGIEAAIPFAPCTTRRTSSASVPPSRCSRPWPTRTWPCSTPPSTRPCRGEAYLYALP